MYYIPELLKRRSGGQLARCWLAATLNETQFKTICKRRELLLVNIEKLCDDIKEGSETLRFSLYLLSQLMYGVLKLQLYKTRALEDLCKQIQATMMPVYVTKRGKRQSEKRTNLLDLPILTADLLTPPSFSEEFRRDLNLPDRHLLEEPDYRLFGVLMEAEHDDFGEREFDRVNAEDLVRFVRGDGLFDLNIDADENNARRENLQGPSLMPLDELNLNDGVLRTPTKRTRETLADTPSKRRRKTLFGPLENQENIPLSVEPINISPTRSPTIDIPPPMENSSRAIFDVDFGGDHPLVNDVTDNIVSREIDANVSLAQPPTESSDITLEPLSLDEILPHQKIKRTKFLDAKIYISNDSMKKQIADPYSMTRSIAKTLVDIDRIHLDSQSLFNIPSTSVRLESNFMWADVLRKIFRNNIKGPFHVHNDEYAFPDSVRVRDTTEKTAELSDDIDQRSFLIPERISRVTDTVLGVRDVAPVEIPHEPIDIGDTRIPDQQFPESELATSLENRSSIAPVAVASTRKPVRSSTSRDSLPSDIMNEVRRGQTRSSSGDKTVDITNIPSSRSYSDSSTFSPQWTKKKLLDELKKRWNMNSQQAPIMFEDIFPPDTTLKSDGACGIMDLLQLATDSEIQLQQAESYAPLYIYLDFD